MSAATQRHAALPGTHNVRDVGGYPTADGRTTRWNTLIRADALHRLTDEGRAHFTSLGLRTVLDLREPIEREHAPDAFGTSPPTLRFLPIFAGRLSAAAAAGLPEIYRQMVDDFAEKLTLAVVELCRPGALPAVVHCSAGKDRTGVVIALALSVAGVEHGVIAEDYALTSEFLGDDYLADIQRRMAAIGLAQSRDHAVACPPELILDTLDRITDKHGTVADFLLANGATQDELDTLRTALVEG